MYLEFNNDGPRGGGPFVDGADGLAAPIHNMANTPIESIEAEQPLLVERYGLIADSGGPGMYRGGLGMVREFRVLVDEATFQLRSDRQDFRPWGLEGGKPGTPTENYINPDTENRQIPAKYLTRMNKGDLYRLVQAGGGGFGDPLDRDVNAVMEDVEQEKLSVEYVRREYGVVIDPETLRVDPRATDELRAGMRSQRGKDGE